MPDWEDDEELLADLFVDDDEAAPLDPGRAMPAPGPSGSGAGPTSPEVTAPAPAATDDSADSPDAEDPRAAPDPPAPVPPVRPAAPAPGAPDAPPAVAGPGTEIAVADPEAVEIEFHRLFASFAVDWARPASYNVLGRRVRRASLLKWTENDLRSVENSSRIYSTVPRRCPGPNPGVDDNGNPLPGCPCQRLYGADPRVWQGVPCPAEVLYVHQQLTKYVRDLGIRAGDHVDVQQVLEIVKLHVYESRCDEDLQRTGAISEPVVGAVNQREGTVYWNRKTPSPLETQERLSARRQKLYKDLLTTRAEKAKLALAARKAEAAEKAAEVKALPPPMDMAQMMAAMAEDGLAQKRDTLIANSARPAPAPVIEGEFRSEDLSRSEEVPRSEDLSQSEAPAEDL